MHWVIQNNLYHEAGYKRFMSVLRILNERFPDQITYEVVKVVPFTDKLLHADFDSMKDDFDTAPEPVIDANQKIMVMGAISLCRIADNKGWTPGSYHNRNFDFIVWRDNFGAENILNENAVVGTVENIVIPSEWDWRFVRPTEDTKSLSGTVMSKNDFHDWRQSIMYLKEMDGVKLPLHKGTMILATPLRQIYTEFRFFVVDGEVVTGAQYKEGHRVLSNNSDPFDDRVWKFAQQMVSKWQPAPAFCLDIADTPDGLKVIEINNINSAGFYGSDVQKLIMAIEDLES